MSGKAIVISVHKGEEGDDGGTLTVKQDGETLLAVDYHGDVIAMEGVEQIAVPATVPVHERTEPQGNNRVIVVIFA